MLAMLAVTASSGCTVIRNEFRTLISEPIKYGNNVDVVRTAKRNRKLAKIAFDQFGAQHPEAPSSRDFRDGFIDGFADFLTFGGSGAPPVVPPRRYWNLPERTPAGHDAVQEWFSGFAAGASEAKISGLREQQTVPSSYAPADDESASWPTGRDFEWAPSDDDDWEPLPTPESTLGGDELDRIDQPDGLEPLPPMDAATLGQLSDTTKIKTHPPNILRMRFEKIDGS